MLARFEIRLEPEIFLDLLCDSGDRLRLGQFENRLGVIRHRAVGIHRDIDGAHAEKAISHKTESENGSVWHDVLEPRSRYQIGPEHQARDEDALPESREVSCYESREDRERCSTFARSGHDLLNMLGVGGGESLSEFRNEVSRQSPASDDRGKLPPERRVRKVAHEQVRHPERGGDAKG